MTIYAVEKDAASLKTLSSLLEKLNPGDEIQCFESSPAALAAARKQPVDVAFIGVNLPELSGMDLGRYLKDLYPFVNLIYLTGKKEDAFDAMGIRASGCLLRPVQEPAVKTELTSLRYSQELKKRKRVFAQTFGNFELFVDGTPIAFRYAKTKEILALLINNRGAYTTNGEIIASLWEDAGDPEKKASYLSNLRQDLQNTLARLKCTDVILKQRGSLAVAVDRIECDLYDWLEKKDKSRYQYLGDYMNQYSWAEYTHAELDEFLYDEDDGDF